MSYRIYIDDNNFFVCRRMTHVFAKIIGSSKGTAEKIRKRLPKGYFAELNFVHNGQIHYYSTKQHGFLSTNFDIFEKPREEKPNTEGFLGSTLGKVSAHRYVYEYRNNIFVRKFIVEDVKAFFEVLVSKDAFIKTKHGTCIKIHPTGIKQEYRLS